MQIGINYRLFFVVLISVEWGEVLQGFKDCRILFGHTLINLKFGQKKRTSMFARAREITQRAKGELRSSNPVVDLRGRGWRRMFEGLPFTLDESG